MDIDLIIGCKISGLSSSLYLSIFYPFDFLYNFSFIIVELHKLSNRIWNLSNFDLTLWLFIHLCRIGDKCLTLIFTYFGGFRISFNIFHASIFIIYFLIFGTLCHPLLVFLYHYGSFYWSLCGSDIFR